MLDQLKHGCAQLGVTLADSQAQTLCQFIQLLARWNRAFNLTAVRDPDEMLSKHILDSLSVAPFIHAPAILDVGTGAGLPGLPLSILYPNKTWYLLDSNGKKTRFLTQTIHELGLKNCVVVNARVEQYLADILFQQIISRAFASLVDMINCCRHLLDEEGQFLAMKRTNLTEANAIPVPFIITQSIPLHVPHLRDNRQLVIIEPSLPGGTGG